MTTPKLDLAAIRARSDKAVEARRGPWRVLILASLLISCAGPARAPCHDVQACIDARIEADRKADTWEGMM